VPVAAEYIEKTEAMGRTGKKRKNDPLLKGVLQIGCGLGNIAMGGGRPGNLRRRSGCCSQAFSRVDGCAT